jgi:uncharacterized protein YsxB (DUF464 family)
MGLHAAGHALRNNQEFSPACAAVTVLLRTAAELFDAENGIETDIRLPEEGLLDINIGEVPQDKRDRCKGFTDFLLYGLLRIAKEAPSDLVLEVNG